MKTSFKESVLPAFRLFVEQSRSYCLQVGIPFIEPTLSQFLAANAMTRDRLLVDKPPVTSGKEITTGQVAENSKRNGMMSFANYVKEQEHKATR